MEYEYPVGCFSNRSYFMGFPDEYESFCEHCICQYCGDLGTGLSHLDISRFSTINQAKLAWRVIRAVHQSHVQVNKHAIMRDLILTPMSHVRSKLALSEEICRRNLCKLFCRKIRNFDLQWLRLRLTNQ